MVKKLKIPTTSEFKKYYENIKTNLLECGQQAKNANSVLEIVKIPKIVMKI